MFFWKELFRLLSWIAADVNIVLNISLLDILFGKFDLEKNFLLVNHILLLAKYFTYRCKLSKIIPSLLVFKAKLKATYNCRITYCNREGYFTKSFQKVG